MHKVHYIGLRYNLHRIHALLDLHTFSPWVLNTYITYVICFLKLEMFTCRWIPSTYTYELKKNEYDDYTV